MGETRSDPYQAYSFGDGEFKPLGVTAEPEIRHRIINGARKLKDVEARDGLVLIVGSRLYRIRLCLHGVRYGRRLGLNLQPRDHRPGAKRSRPSSSRDDHCQLCRGFGRRG